MKNIKKLVATVMTPAEIVSGLTGKFNSPLAKYPLTEIFRWVFHMDLILNVRGVLNE